MTAKPSTMWHADGEGKCHAGCEARRSDAPGTWYCRICENLPWETFRDAPGDGSGCPFAVLADVLCAVKPHEEKPDDSHRCPTCAVAETIECGAGLIDRDPMRCWRPKPDEDRRCGTCANTEQGCCPYMQVFDEKGTSVGHYVAAMAGPPWPNCRFWSKR